MTNSFVSSILSTMADNSKKIDHFDVAFVGAGPGGVSVGSELSKDFKILMVDKRNMPGSGESESIPKNEVITKGE